MITDYRYRINATAYHSDSDDVILHGFYHLSGLYTKCKLIVYILIIYIYIYI